MERPILPAGPVRPAAEAGLATLDVVARTRVASAAAAALAGNTRATLRVASAGVILAAIGVFRRRAGRPQREDPRDADQSAG